MTNIKFFSLIRIGLVLALAAPTMAVEPYEGWPSKDQLRSIEQAAYASSRLNSTKACVRVPQLSNL